MSSRSHRPRGWTSSLHWCGVLSQGRSVRFQWGNSLLHVFFWELSNRTNRGVNSNYRRCELTNPKRTTLESARISSIFPDLRGQPLSLTLATMAAIISTICVPSAIRPFATLIRYLSILIIAGTSIVSMRTAASFSSTPTILRRQPPQTHTPGSSEKSSTLKALLRETHPRHVGALG